jgi:hypothetical protein
MMTWQHGRLSDVGMIASSTYCQYVDRLVEVLFYSCPYHFFRFINLIKGVNLLILFDLKKSLGLNAIFSSVLKYPVSPGLLYIIRSIYIA